MLIIKIPNFCKSELKYSLNVLLNEFLGLNFEIKIHDSDNICITNANKEGQITLDTSFFQSANQSWLNIKSMPKVPLDFWDPSKDELKLNLVDEKLPVIYGKPGLIRKKGHIHLNIDIFGSAFFMLSRYEELISSNRDEHDRFPACESVSYKEGFLNRPIINEYLEVLKECFVSIWPDINFLNRDANNFITCDVDWPYDPSMYSIKYMAKKFFKLLLLNRDISKAIKCTYMYLLVKFNMNYQDPYREGINWIMDINEKYGNKVAFFFITHFTSSIDTIKDAEYDSTKIRNLFKEIKKRGHEIGVHPGYETYKNSKNFKETVDRMKKIIREESLDQENIGGRQHFLRWTASHTPQLWEENNLQYDSTLSYADIAGFRCGICYEYTMYDLIDRRALRLKQRPLIVMECSIISKRYENLKYSKESLKRFEYFKKTCHQFNGTFNLLWHNSHFNNKNDKIFYEKIIR